MNSEWTAFVLGVVITVAVLGLLVIMPLALIWPSAYTRLQKQAVEHGAAAYDKGGNWHWIEQPQKASQP